MDTTEDERRAIICDLIERYLAGELDRTQLTEWVTILRLRDDWSPGDSNAASLLWRVVHHLFMFERGDWPEDDLRSSLAQLQDRMDAKGARPGTAMFGAQWLELLRAGHIPPGTRFVDSAPKMRSAIDATERGESGS